MNPTGDVVADVVADVVVVGAGHNGLVCAAYLARAGVRVLVLEARDSVGGCASSVEALGARFNVCSCDHTMILTTPMVEELRLTEHGLRYLSVDPSRLVLPWDGGQPFVLFADVDRTVDALQQTHPDEVAGYRSYLRAAMPAARLLLDVVSGPPTSGNVMAAVARQGRGAAVGVMTLLRWTRSSFSDVITRYFASPALLGAASTGPAVWGLAPSTPGTGKAALGFATTHLSGVWRHEGGSGALTTALLSAVTAAGGTVRCGAVVDEIVVDGHHVVGVRLDTGEVVECATVVSSTDPRTTLVQWLRNPPAGARALQRRWGGRKRGDGYRSKIDAVLAEPPRYRGIDDAFCARVGLSDPLVPTTYVAPGLTEMEVSHRLLASGRVADRPFLLAGVPTALDPSLRVGSSRRHVLSLEALWTPYGLAGGWRDSAEPRRWLTLYASLLEPGFMDTVVNWRVVTPPDYERDFRLDRGYTPSFTGGPLAALVGRDRELTRYETPVPGLFLTGAGTFPGAGVWGASGRNAAAVVLAKLGANARGGPGPRRTVRVASPG